MSKARRVSKILDGELKTEGIGLTNPTREGKADIPAGLESQKDANVYIGERLDALETPEGLPEHTHDFADKDHTHPKQDFDHEHDAEYAQRTHRHDTDYAPEGHSHDQKYEQLNHAASEHQRLDDKIDNHAGTQHNFLPLAGGEMGPSAKIDWPSNTGVVDGLQAAYKDQMPVRKKEFDEAVGGLSAGDHDHPHDHDSAYAAKGHTHDADTAPHTHDEYQAKGDYAAGDHDHPPQDLTHDHDAQYAPVHDHPYASDTHTHPYAADDHTHDAQDLTHDHDSDYAPIHEHPYAADDHEHPPPDLTHDHDDYFSKGSASDGDGNPVPLPYGDAMELGAAVDDLKEENGEQNDRLDALEAAPPVAIGDNPPADEKSKDGDLWWDSVRMEMFIRYQEAWITTNALSARVEAGEQVQAELLARVAVGEDQQEILQNKVRALEGAISEHPFAFEAGSINPRNGKFVMMNRTAQPTAVPSDARYILFSSTDDNGSTVEESDISDGDILRISGPDGRLVEFKSAGPSNGISFISDGVVRSELDEFTPDVVYGATFLSQQDKDDSLFRVIDHIENTNSIPDGGIWFADSTVIHISYKTLGGRIWATPVTVNNQGGNMPWPDDIDHENTHSSGYNVPDVLMSYERAEDNMPMGYTVLKQMTWARWADADGNPRPPEGGKQTHTIALKPNTSLHYSQMKPPNNTVIRLSLPPWL